jgi:hypothetical protein
MRSAAILPFPIIVAVTLTMENEKKTIKDVLVLADNNYDGQA